MLPISVIVPVYKVEKYLNRCVNSILAQIFIDFELILVDDGSPDNCGMICDEYSRKDKRISVIHKENGGLSSARNAGIAVAKGEYLCFVDSDDMIHPKTLQILWEEKERTTAEVVAGKFVRVNSENDFPIEMSEYECQVFSSMQILKKMYDDKEYVGQYVSACGKLWKRELFHNIEFPIGRLFEDEFTTYLLYYKANKICIVDKVVYFYFINESGITQNLTVEKRFDEYDAQWQRISFWKSEKINELYHLALLEFLKSARWDLIRCREQSEKFDIQRGALFDKQYRTVFQLAKKENILPFEKYYEYYILGNPKYILFYRIKRLILKALGKMR